MGYRMRATGRFFSDWHNYATLAACGVTAVLVVTIAATLGRATTAEHQLEEVRQRAGRRVDLLNQRIDALAEDKADLSTANGALAAQVIALQEQLRAAGQTPVVVRPVVMQTAPSTTIPASTSTTRPPPVAPPVPPTTRPPRECPLPTVPVNDRCLLPAAS